MTAARPYTIPELAERWQVSTYTVYELIRQGELRAFQVGAKLYRVAADEVARWENTGSHTETGPTGSDSSKAKRSSRGGTPAASGTVTASESSERSKRELRLMRMSGRSAP